MLRYLAPMRARMGVGFTIKVLGTLIELAIPQILSYILDEIVQKNDLGLVFAWGGLMLLCVLGALVGNIVANRMASRVARDGARAIRHDLFAKIMHLSARDVDRFTVPSLESRLTTDTYNVHNFIGMIQRIGIRAPLLLVGGLAFTLMLDPVLTLVMLGVMPLIVLTVFLVSSRGIPLYRKAQKSVDGMVRVVREDSQGVRVIRALSQAGYERQRFETVNRQLTQDEKRAQLTMILSNPLINLFINIGLVGVIFFGATRVSRSLTSPATIIAFMQFFVMVSNGILALTRIFVQATKSTASMNRIDEVLRCEEDCAVDLTHARTAGTVPGAPLLCFDHVTFGYLDGKVALKDLSFSLEKGQMLGIIGSTGSGKSTILQLMMRFYDVNPDGGGVFLEGRDVRSMTAEQVRSRFGIVRQNDFLYADTIAENIRFGREAGQKDLLDAAERAQALDFITRLPDSFEHRIASHGADLSGGQRQRLLIARALLGHPDILILDDSSSALDYRTDANLRHAIAALPERPTTVVVAQRISAVQEADLILVLDHGQVIGAGKHEELMRTCPVYEEIARSQMGDGNGGAAYE